jgi:predicted enzyme related to lactoylglutathione lyase
MQGKTKMKKSPVVHFEMPYKDPKRASEFYSSVFGWGMNDAGKDMGGYIVAETSETDKNRMVKTPGNINGGFYNLKQSPKSKEPSVVIAVDDVTESIKMIKEAGGKILGKIQDIPGIGKWVSFRDTEGNRVSILQPSM